MRFRATLEASGKAAPGIQVPAELVGRLGAGRRPPVRVTIAGHTYRSTIVALGERFLLEVNAENRAAAGVTVGDELEVEIELDTEPRVPAVPHDPDATPDDGAPLRSAFEALASGPPRPASPAEGSKADLTRQQRLAKALKELRTGRR